MRRKLAQTCDGSMTSFNKKAASKIKDYIEEDNYTKLKRYLGKNEISMDEIITKKGEKMLHLAAKEGSSYCTEYLLENGAKPNLVDKNGNLPIHRALKYVIENYSRSKEKNLVNLLLTYSSRPLCYLFPNSEREFPRFEIF